MMFATFSLNILKLTSKSEKIVSIIIFYFLIYSLGTIAHSHLAFANQSAFGPKDPRCLKLARMHRQMILYTIFQLNLATFAVRLLILQKVALVHRD